jgi:hypothetical protein
MESNWGRARRDFHGLVTNTIRFALWVALWGIASTAASIYFSWGHKRGAQVGIGVAAFALGVALAFALPLLWFYLRAPQALLRERVEALERVALSHAPPPDVDSLRGALMAVRGELGACAIRITEALDSNKWWRASDELPGIHWQEQFATLTDPAVPPDLHAQIELAYQRCDRLNHRVRGRWHAWRERQIFPVIVPSTIYDFEVGDADLLRDVRRELSKTNEAISARVDGVRETRPS